MHRGLPALIQKQYTGVRTNAIRFLPLTGILPPYLTVDGPLMTAQSFTVEMWVYIENDPFGGSSVWIANERGSNAGNNNWQIFYSGTSGNIAGLIRVPLEGGGEESVGVDLVSNPQRLTWYHLAFVCDGTNKILRGYLNGKLVDTNSTGWFGDRIIANSRFRVAVTGWGTPTFELQGMIDDMRLWNNVVRTDEQISKNAYKRLTTKETGLSHYYPFNGNANDSKGTADFNLANDDDIEYTTP